jgi:hypothetical protein
MHGDEKMTDEANEFAERVAANLRSNFPEDYPETRYDVPKEVISYSASYLYAEIIGLMLKFGRDKRVPIADRIAAFEVARKAGRDQIEILELEAGAACET